MGAGAPGAPQQAGLARQQAPHQQQVTIEYDKRPRPVRFTPYTHEDYVQRNYDSKTQKGYWALGSLGPGNEDQELLVRNTISFDGDTFSGRPVWLAIGLCAGGRPDEPAAHAF